MFDVDVDPHPELDKNEFPQFLANLLQIQYHPVPLKVLFKVLLGYPIEIPYLECHSECHLVLPEVVISMGVFKVHPLL